MSKQNKLERIDKLIKRNQEILHQIDKLKNEYCHNNTCVKNLYGKAQVEDFERHNGYDKYSYGFDIFE